jgi:hypothetical protein
VGGISELLDSAEDIRRFTLQIQHFYGITLCF